MTTTKEAFKLPFAGNSDDFENLQQVTALELAIGSSLPRQIENWPLGLAMGWNSAADSGAFDKCKTLGDLSRAYLNFRLERLGH